MIHSRTAHGLACVSLAAGLSVALLTGCGSGGNGGANSDGKVTITVAGLVPCQYSELAR